MAKHKHTMLWGGFVDDRLDEVSVDYGWGGYGTGDLVTIPAIFKTRREARAKYQDVRRITIFPSALSPPLRGRG